MVNGPIWTIIDYEWTYGKCIPAKEQVWRALYCYRLEDRKREAFDPAPVYARLGLTDAEIKDLLEEEYAFQKYVTGNRKSMVEIWKSIGRRVIVPKELQGSSIAARPDDCIQIYMDHGEGYSEDDSIFPEEQYDEKNKVSLDVRVPAGCKVVRVDPAFAPCIVTILEAEWNGKSLSDPGSNVDIHPVNGEWISDDTMIFDTGDPNIEFGLTGKVGIQERNHLKLSLLTTLIPEESARAVVESVHTEEGPETAKKGNIFGRIGKKITKMREERFYKDEEWD